MATDKHTQADATPRDPLEWTTGDRMRKALDVSGVSVQDIAERLGTSRNSVSRWINGRGEPKLSTLRQFAAQTRVPVEWLVSGRHGADAAASALPAVAAALVLTFTAAAGSVLF